ncbi:TPA: PIN-like domain-containing protein [Providencia alcalifaciens]
MKDKFSEFYSNLPNVKISDIDNLTLVFDTNIFMYLYLFDEKMQDAFFYNMKKNGFKVFVPYNVGLEYQVNRDFQIKNKDIVKQRVDSSFSSITKTIDEMVNSISSYNNKKLKVLIDNINTLKDEILNLTDEFIKNNFDDFKCSSNQDYFLDSIRNRIDEMIYEVGEPYEEDRLKVIYKNGDDRFEKKIPPGFKDSGKGNEAYYHNNIEYIRKYGDLVIWMQVLDYLKSCDSGSFVLFVTNDLKSDFWKNINNYKIPHPFLKKEANSTNPNVIFDMITADEFFNQIMIDDSSESQSAKEEIKETINVVLNPNNMVQVINSIEEDEGEGEGEEYYNIRRAKQELLARHRRLSGIDEEERYQRLRQAQEEALARHRRLSGIDEEKEHYERLRQAQEEALARHRRLSGIDEEKEHYERLRRAQAEALARHRRLSDIDDE